MAHARYDVAADFYVQGFHSADDPVSLALLDLLGPVASLRVLDVACGHGRMTRELASRGAHVTGIDISGRLIATAREAEQDDPLGISYIHADVTEPDATWAQCAATGCGSTSWPSRFLSRTGTRPMTPTASRSISWPGWSRRPDPRELRRASVCG